MAIGNPAESKERNNTRTGARAERPSAGPRVDAADVRGPAPTAGPLRTAQGAFIENVDSQAAFDAYCETVGSERYAKFLIEIDSDQIYYFDANAFAVHADFVLAELTKRWNTSSRVLQPLADLYNRWQVRERLRVYNDNYSDNKPEFLLGTVVHHTDQDLYTLALWEGDMASPAEVRRVWDKVVDTFYQGNEVRFRPNSTRQEDLLGAPELDGVPTITNDKLYKDAPYHAFTEGTAVGRLRIVRTGDPTGLHFATDEIPVLTEILPDITPVRGLITETFCTPLSHVALRARAWGIPHIGLKECSTTYGELDGKMVYLEAKKEGATLRAATDEDVAREEARREEAGGIELPPADLETREVAQLPTVRASQVQAYGAKSANLGEIAHAALASADVPEGFAIPIVYYAEHLERHGLRERAEALVADPQVASDPVYREAQLEELREAIIAAPIDPELEQEISRRMAEGTPDRRVFVRSSTNAEDLAGLNGAGLYDSVPNVQGVEQVGVAVKRVWASVWNLRAFDERAHFGIDHMAVYGAVLVLDGVNATAAGVLITANVFESGAKRAYTINAKNGVGIGVVEGTNVPEQILFDPGEGGIKIMSRCDDETMLVFDEAIGGVKEVPNTRRGEPVLSESQVRTLAQSAEAILGLFPDDGPLDIEFLFVDDRLQIVQSRPYIGL